MVDRYTKVVLTIIAVGLWVQVGLQLNPVRSAAAEFGWSDSATLELMAKHLDNIEEWNAYQEMHLSEIKNLLRN